MIQTVSVTNPKGETLEMELTNPWKSGFIVQSIEGIGPGQVDIISTDLANADGSIYTSSRMGNRSVILTLKLLENPTIEDSRQKTYRYFPIKKPVTLTIKTDNRNAYVVGYVESNEPVIFSSQEYTQISLLCVDPYFYELAGEEIAFSGTLPAFEFPFQNESLTEPELEFGDIRLDTRVVLNYIGDIDTGFNMTIHALDNCRDITIYNVNTYESMKINVSKIETLTGKKFGVGDDIIVSTVSGSKYVRLLREGIYTNIISALDKDSDWFTISPGDNIFAYNANGDEKKIMITFRYQNAYGGI